MLNLPPNYFFNPWHIMHGRAEVQAYVESLGKEAHEWLLALWRESRSSSYISSGKRISSWNHD